MEEQSPNSKPKKKKGEARGLSGRALSGIFWIGSSSWILSGIRVFVVAILARLLSPAEFGVVAAVALVIGFNELFLNSGLGRALIQVPELREDHVKTGFTFSVLSGVVLGAIVWFLAPWIAGLMRLPDEGTLMLQSMSVVFPLRSISLVSKSLMQRELLYKSLAGSEVISYTIGYGCVAILLARQGFGSWALVGATISEALILSFIMFIRQPHTVAPGISTAALKDLVGVGVGFSASQFLNFSASKGDSFVVTRWLGPASIGVYSRAFSLAETFNSLITSTLSKVLFPAFAKVQRDQARLASGYKRSFGLLLLLFLPVSVASVILAPEIIGVILGPKWTEAVMPFTVLSIGLVFRVAYKMGGIFALGSSILRQYVYRQALFVVLVIGGALIGMRWGIAGVAISRLLALVVHGSLMTRLALRICGLRWKDLWPSLIPSGFTGVCVGLELFLVASVLRGLTIHPGIILLVSAIVVGISAVIALKLFPKTFLGADGLWLIGKFSEQFGSLSKKLPFIRRALVPSNKSAVPETEIQLK